MARDYMAQKANQVHEVESSPSIDEVVSQSAMLPLDFKFD